MPEPDLSRMGLRRLIEAVLPTDDDITAICVDCFPEVRRHWGSGHGPVAKISMLLEHVPPLVLLDALRQYSPERYDAYAYLLPLTADRRHLANPYRGLAAFQTEDCKLFFGREDLTHKLWQRFKGLYECSDGVRLLAVLGPSGSGKSSVARAGLLAALRERPVPGPDAPHVIILRPGGWPLRSLAVALRAATVGPQAAQDVLELRSLVLALNQANARGALDGLTLWAAGLPRIDDSPVVLLIDQFEEIYTLCADSTERNAFVAGVLHAARDRARHVSVVLTLRSDFLGETQRQHPELNWLIAEQEIIVPSLRCEELRRSIARPAEAMGRPLDTATIELLLAEARGGESSLPLLEFALARIWEGMAAGHEPSVTFRDIGGIGGALSGKVQQIYGALTDRQQAIARRALVRMVQLGEGVRDTRRRVPLRALCGHNDTEEDVLRVLRQFASESARIVTLSGNRLEPLAEVTHEALFEHWDELRRWIHEGREERRFHDRAAEAARLWDEAERPPGRLWRAPDLDLLDDYCRRRPDEISVTQLAFLRAAKQQLRREHLLRLSAAVTILLALILVGCVYLLKERQRTLEARRAGEEFRQQLLSTYVERGRQLLVQEQKPVEALPWLSRALGAGAKDKVLPDLIREALRTAGAPRLVLSGHGDRLTHAAISADGRRIVTSSYDKTARIWDTQTGRCRIVLAGHVGIINSAAFTPDGRHVITASEDHTVRIWEAETGRLLHSLTGHSAPVNSVAVSGEGSRFVTTSNDATARIWEVETGRPLAELRGHSGRVLKAVFRSDGRQVVTASEDRTARVWEAESGLLVATFKGHTERINTATYSTDDRIILTASDDRTARLWEAKTGERVAELKGHRYSVSSAQHSPSSRFVATAGADSTARIWDANTGRVVHELEGHQDCVKSVAYSPDGRSLVTASDDKTARIWDVMTGELIAELRGHSAAVRGAMFLPEGQAVLTFSEDNTARIWEASRSPIVAQIEAAKTAIHFTDALYARDSRRIVAASLDQIAGIWDAETGRLLTEFKGHDDRVNRAAFSPDERRVVTASANGAVRVWDAQTGRPIAQLSGHRTSVNSAEFSPDGRHIVTASFDHSVRIWEAETGRAVGALKGDILASYNRDGRYILVADLDGTSHIWEAATGRLIADLQGGSVARYSPDGRRIVTVGSSARKAWIWDAQSIALIAELQGHDDDVRNAVFAPDGLHLVTVSADKTARVWSTGTGRLVHVLRGHAGAVTRAAFSPDGLRIVTGSEDKSARIWWAETGRMIGEFKGHINGISNVSYSPDGRRLLVASFEAVRIWDVAATLPNPSDVAKRMRCYWPMRFDREDSDVLISFANQPAECQ